MTPDVIYDQLIGMGSCRAGWSSRGAAIPASARCTASATPSSTAGRGPLELEEHSHAGMAAAYAAGAANLPFAVLRGYAGTDLAGENPDGAGRSTARSPASGSRPCARSGPTSRSSTPSRPTARATSSSGGSAACRRRPCWRPARSIVTVEEVVEELEPRPHAVVLPGLGRRRRSASCRAARDPSYAHGYYERDNGFYAALGRDLAATASASRAGCASTCSEATGGPRPRACMRRRRSDARRDDDRQRRARAARRAPSASSASAFPARAANLARATPRAELRARLRVAARSGRSRRACRSRSATTSWPRPPTRSSRCPRSSATGSGAAASTSASSPPRRSTGTRNINSDGHRRLRPPRGAPARAPAARPRSRPRAKRDVIVLLRQIAAHVRRAARLPHLGRLSATARGRASARVPRRAARRP